VIREYCPDCKQMRPFRRTLTIGTLLATVCTAGFWLLTVPFYKHRCITCGLEYANAGVPQSGSEKERRDAEDDAVDRMDKVFRIAMIIGAIAAAFMVLFYLLKGL
jgi:hypothetical protein